MPRYRRSPWLRRLLIGANITVAACLVFAASGYTYVQWRMRQIKRVDVAEELRHEGNDKPGEPMNVLVVGSDSRENIAAAERAAFGRDTGPPHTDTILVLRIEPATGRAVVLSIPRDLWVPIAGGRGEAKINSAFAAGPDRLIATIRDALGIDVDHYAEVDFTAFRGVVDVLGGVDIRFTTPVRDTMSGLDVRPPGCVHLDGNRALQFVRSRSYERFERGRWHEDPRQDLGRIERQQAFIRLVLDKATAAARNPLTLNALFDRALPKVTLDTAFDTEDLRELAARFRSLSGDDLEVTTLPVTVGRVGTQSVVFLDDPEGAEAIDRFLGRTPPAPSSSTTAAPTTTAPSTSSSTTTTTTLGLAC